MSQILGPGEFSINNKKKNVKYDQFFKAHAPAKPQRLNAVQT